MRSRKRFVLSIKTECLNKIIPLGEKHLRLSIKEYMAHYHTERNHQGLESHIIHADDHDERSEGAIKTRSRLGGFLNYNADNRIMPRQYVLSCFYCVFLRFYIVYAA